MWGLQVLGVERSPPIAEQLERRPVERMGRFGLLPDLIDLRRPQGLVLGFAIVEMTVKALHEGSGGDVRDAPHGGEDGAGAGELEGADQADYLLVLMHVASVTAAIAQVESIRLEMESLTSEVDQILQKP